MPPWIGAALRRGLARDPAARFPDVRALLTRLRTPPRRIRGLIAVAALGEPSLLAARLSVGLAQVGTGGSAELHGDEIVPMLANRTFGREQFPTVNNNGQVFPVSRVP